MKRSIAILLLLAMILGVFAGCGKQGAEPTEAPTVAPTEDNVPANAKENLAAAAEYLKTYYKDALTLTGRDFTRLGAVRVGLDQYPITWSVNVSEDVIKIVVNEDGTVTIDIADGIKEETPYVLTATLTDAYGNVETVDFEHTIPASLGTMQEIVDLAYALENGAAMDQEVTLTGEIISVNTPYDAGYKNVTVTIKVAEREDFPIMCYRLKGEGADTITVGDTITVTGIIKNYNGTIEFDAGCVLEEVIKGSFTFDLPEDPKEIVDMAYALGVSESIPVKVTLTGKVTDFKETYTDQYKNISVWMAIEGRETKPILAYRLISGEGGDVKDVAVGDTITVTGTIVNYNGTIEFNAKCTMDARVSGGGKPPAEPVSNFWSTVPVVGESYYLFMDINGVNYYFNGKMSGNYLGTSTNSGDAVEVTVEQSNGYGYRFYFMDKGVKKYIEIYEYTRDDGKNRGAVRIVEEPTVTFYWSGKAHTYTVYGGITNDLYFLGTYGTYTTFSVSSIYYITGNNAPNAGVTQYIADLMKPEDAPAPEEPPVVPETPSALTFVDAPVVGTAYKFAMKQNGISGSPVLGITGQMNGFYYATTETESEMVDVYLEKTTGGYHIYFMNGTTKTYLDVIPRSNDATKTNVVFQTSGEHSVYTLNTEFKYVVTTVNGTDWYLGTYNALKTVSASKTSYIEDTSKIGVSQFCAWFAVAGEGGSTEPEQPEQPEQPTVPTDKVTNGAKVVIYNPAHKMALSTKASGFYSAGVAITITDGVMTGYGDTEVFTVTINEDGTYTFTNGGKNFGMADDFASTSMGGKNDKWQVTDLGNGLYLIKNVVRGNYLEWYASKNNWSTYNSSSAATDPLYQQAFYIVEAGATEPEDPEVNPDEEAAKAVDALIEKIGTVTKESEADIKAAREAYNKLTDAQKALVKKLAVLEAAEKALEDLNKPTVPTDKVTNGAKVVIYNPAHKMALSTKASGFYSAGVAITITDGVMTGYGDTEVFTVTINEDGTYIFTNGGQNFGMGDSYTSTSMGGKNDKWQVTDLGNGLYLIKNVVRGNYLEWYASKNNWSTYNPSNAATDPLYQQSFYIVEAGSAEPECKHTNTKVEGAKEATCTEPGHTGKTVCVDCGETIDAGTEIPVIAHNYVNGKCECGAVDPNYTPVEPETPAASNKADFNTIKTSNANGDSSYTKTYTTANGWVVKNSAIQTGGPEGCINPQFTVIGPDNTHKAPCLNGGKTVGSITSPTLTGGISKLTMKYTKIFTDKKLAVTVTITDVTTGNKYTHVVERDVANDAKYTVWDAEWILETPVTGDFTIEVVNNCPSGGSTSKNLDRMTVLELAWEGAHAHKYEATTTATCVADGITTYTCKCGDTYTEETAKLGHIDENLDVDCDRDGCTSKVAPPANSLLSNFTANNLGSKLSSSYQYYVQGTIVEVLDAKNGIFLIDDGTGETFYFRLPKNADGVSHASWAIKLTLGDKVKVYGKINKYTTNTAPNGQFWPAIQGGVVTLLEQHPHDFTFSAADCRNPAACACGQTNGAPRGCVDTDGNNICDDCGKNTKYAYEYVEIRTDNNSGVHDATAYTYTWTNGNFGVQVAKATGGNLYVTSNNHMRLYKNNQFVLTNKNGLAVKTIIVYLTNATQVTNFEKMLTGYTYTTNAVDFTITVQVDSFETLTLTNTGSTTQVKGVEFGYAK